MNSYGRVKPAEFMNSDVTIWVDYPRWSKRWEVIEQLPKGGQGDSFKVRRKTDGRIAFLKSITAKTNAERRARFFREASAYNIFRVDRVPRLIESNAHQHDKPEFQPYLATEFIDGPTLRAWREKQTGVDLAVAVAMTGSLLAILKQCHTKECVHRDIKPDNIIVINSDPQNIELLDFGLSYHEAPEFSFQTETGQEIGNRFLRLPELSAGSLLKQDLRSDLSFAGGILFYLLTGLNPDVLVDAEGMLPHQRSQALSMLKHVTGVRLNRLLSFFDIALAPRISDRFSSADAMLAGIDRMMTAPMAGSSPEEDLNAILEIVHTAAERRRVASAKRIDEALRQVDHVFRYIEKSLNGSFTIGQTAFSVQGDSGSNTLFWLRPGSTERILSTIFTVREVGDEIIIQLSGETVFRTPIISPNYGEQFQLAVRSWVLARLREAIT